MKVALVMICLNPRYWPFLKDVLEDADKNFLKGHQVDKFVWTDMPEVDAPEFATLLQQHKPEMEIKASLWDLALEARGAISPEKTLAIQQAEQDINKQVSREILLNSVSFLRNRKDLTIIPTDPIEWPMGTLMRYTLFLQEEEKLKDYDYIFYLDVDMRIVGTVGDDIMGDGLTMAKHPMYALARRYIPPYEPNPESTAYIPRFGQIIADENGNPRLEPLYAAGGFQGGKSAAFIKAMHSMKKAIDKDLIEKNYIAIWNDESHWNYYLSQNHPAVVLHPGYIYPDSLIKEYYVSIWGRDYEPKIVTLTKKFTLTRQGGNELRRLMGLPDLPQPFICPTCQGELPSNTVKVVSCGGSGKMHEVEQKK